MGNGEDVLMPWLNDYLLSGSRANTSPVEAEVNKRTHPVPNGPKEMQGSQNLFLLEAGCDAAIHGKLSPQLEKELIVRLQKERDEVGLWGSECTSPIYHHFTITGWSAIYHNTSNVVLKELIEQNLGSFFWYALRMGLADSKHGLIGMRGTGHDFAESGFPDLHFVCQYFTSGRPKDYTKLSSWKPMFKDSGWAMAGVAGGRNYELYKKAFEYAVDDTWEPWKLRSKLTFVKISNIPIGHFYEKGINGNTPALLAYMKKLSNSVSGYLPLNCTIRVRQHADNSLCLMNIRSKKDTSYQYVAFSYSGIYTSLTGGSETTVASYCIQPGYDKVSILTSDLSGVSGWTQIYPSQSVPQPTIPLPTESSNNQNPATPPRKKKFPWWMFWK